MAVDPSAKRIAPIRTTARLESDVAAAVDVGAVVVEAASAALGHGITSTMIDTTNARMQMARRPW